MKRVITGVLVTLVLGIVPELSSAQTACSGYYPDYDDNIMSYISLPCNGVCALVGSDIECYGDTGDDHFAAVSNETSGEVFIWGWVMGGDDDNGDPIIDYFCCDTNKDSLGTVTRLWVFGDNGDDDILLQPAGSMTYHGTSDLYGDDGFDYILGGNDDSVIDRIYGGMNRDVIYGGDGIDIISGGYGNDVIYGEEGIGYLKGDSGDDYIRGGDEDDDIFGGDGNDHIWGYGGDDYIHGEHYATGSGDDVIWGGQGSDDIYGGPGNDTIYGGEASGIDMSGDCIFGEEGEDYIDGGWGADGIHGGPDSDDRLIGGVGNDTICGGDDAIDVIQPGFGTDYCSEVGDTFIDLAENYLSEANCETNLQNSKGCVLPTW